MRLLNTWSKVLSKRSIRTGWTLFLSVGVVAGMLGLAILLAAWRMGSVGAGIAFLKGNRIYAQPDKLIIAGDGSRAESVTFMNLTNRSIRVTGYTSACSCLTVTELPLVLGPREFKDVSISAISKTREQLQVLFLTDEFGPGAIPVSVTVIPNLLERPQLP